MTYITQEHQMSKREDLDANYNNFFSNSKQQINYSYGLELYIIYNANNIISVNYGISPNKNFGNKGLYVGASLLF